MAKLDSLGRSRWKAWLGSMCRNSPSSSKPTRARKVKTPSKLDSLFTQREDAASRGRSHHRPSWGGGEGGKGRRDEPIRTRASIERAIEEAWRTVNRRRRGTASSKSRVVLHCTALGRRHKTSEISTTHERGIYLGRMAPFRRPCTRLFSFRSCLIIFRVASCQVVLFFSFRFVSLNIFNAPGLCPQVERGCEQQRQYAQCSINTLLARVPLLSKSFLPDDQTEIVGGFRRAPIIGGKTPA